MSVIIVGGDHLGHIEKRLYERGVSELIHVSGRKKSDNKRLAFNKKITAVLVFTDYINHNLMDEVKEQARCFQIPVIFARRAWSDIERKLTVEGLIQCQA